MNSKYLVLIEDVHDKNVWSRPFQDLEAARIKYMHLVDVGYMYVKICEYQDGNYVDIEKSYLSKG